MWWNEQPKKHQPLSRKKPKREVITYDLRLYKGPGASGSRALIWLEVGDNGWTEGWKEQ